VNGRYSIGAPSQVTRTRQYQDYGHYSALKIRYTQRSPNHVFPLITSSVVARNNDILKRLVLEAKREYEKDSNAEHRVHIFMADTYEAIDL
jgi:mitochondrial chaperone BCS1